MPEHADLVVDELIDHPAGAPDCLDRLWTPYRMVYIQGGNKPADASTGECPFCRAVKRSDEDSLIIYRGEYCYLICNLYPYNPGHLLVCPYQHLASYLDLPAEQLREFTEITRQAIQMIKHVSSPAGFNIGMNQGEVAGAGIAAHLHQHIVPRWLGDANFLPIVGQTKAVPQFLAQTRELFAAGWAELFGSEGVDLAKDGRNA